MFAMYKVSLRVFSALPSNDPCFLATVTFLTKDIYKSVLIPKATNDIVYTSLALRVQYPKDRFVSFHLN